MEFDSGFGVLSGPITAKPVPRPKSKQITDAEQIKAFDDLLLRGRIDIDTRVRRQSFIQTMDGRTIVQDFDFESQPTDLICESHPDRPWPHGNCPGPGMPKSALPSVASVMNDPTFLAYCTKAGIAPSRRQASKWRKKKGQAFNTKRKADKQADELADKVQPDKRAPRAWGDEEV
jgi:hypothetical protein